MHQPAFVVDVVGTTGAGDAAYGAFLAAMLHGLPPAECAQMACAVGACNAEQADATSGVRPWDETRQRIAAGWATQPPSPMTMTGAGMFASMSR